MRAEVFILPPRVNVNRAGNLYPWIAVRNSGAGGTLLRFAEARRIALIYQIANERIHDKVMAGRHCEGASAAFATV
jgi:hypothetical protein